MKKRRLARNDSGQALIETVLVMLLLVPIILNVFNFAYFFIVALNLTASPRSGVEYSIVGFQTPGSLVLPSADNISSLSAQDLYGALGSLTNATIQVCSSTVGPSSTPCKSCTVSATGTTTCGSAISGSPAPASDPEASFVLNRVDVDYVFTPPIPGDAFNLALLPLAVCSSGANGVTCRFHRQVSMREMN